MLKKGISFFLFLFSFTFSFSQTTGVQIQDLKSFCETAIRDCKYQDAIVFLEKHKAAIKNDTAYFELFEWLGELYLLQNNWDKVILLYSGHHFQKEEDSTLLTMAKYFKTAPKEKIDLMVSSAVAYQPSKTGTPVVEVIINGKKYRFWVDTGAGMTVVTSSVAKNINLKQSQKNDASATAATGIKIDVGYGVIDSLKVGSMKVTDLPCLVLSDKQLEFRLMGIRIMKIDGIIGWNLLQELSVTIDPIADIVSFAPSAGPHGRTNQFFWMGVPLIECKDEKGRSLLFTFDSGANISAVYPSYAQKEDTSNAIHKSMTIGSAGGMKRMKTLKYPLITFYGAGQTIQLKNVSTDPSLGEGSLTPDGVLGSNILKNYIVHFDLKAGVFDLNLDHRKKR